MEENSWCSPRFLNLLVESLLLLFQNFLMEAYELYLKFWSKNLFEFIHWFFALWCPLEHFIIFISLIDHFCRSLMRSTRLPLWISTTWSKCFLAIWYLIFLNPNSWIRCNNLSRLILISKEVLSSMRLQLF